MLGRLAPLLVAILAAGCTRGVASPSPGGFQEVFEALARRGATVTQIVSGDPGCADRTLVANAVRFTLRLDDGVVREVHLFGFRDAAALAGAQDRLKICMREFETAGSAGSSGSVQVGPFEAFGRPWSGRLGALLEAALGEAVRGT